MKLKLRADVKRGDIQLRNGQIFEVVDIVGKDYIIEVPMKQKGKFKRVLVHDDEAELLE